MVQATFAPIPLVAAAACLFLSQTVAGAVVSKETVGLNNGAFAPDTTVTKWINGAGTVPSEATNSESSSSVADDKPFDPWKDSALTSEASAVPADAGSPSMTRNSNRWMSAVNSSGSTQMRTQLAALRSQLQAALASLGQLETVANERHCGGPDMDTSATSSSSHVVATSDREAETVPTTTTEASDTINRTPSTSHVVATSDREAETVPTTTTEASDTINRTTASPSECPTSAGSASEPTAPNVPAPERRVCRTDACYRQAQRMAAMMNHTMQPCRNFYVTACGGLQTDPLLQQYDPQQEAFRRIADVTRSSKELPSAIKKLREFEESCLQYRRNMTDKESLFAEVRKVMNNIGNFSFDAGEWKDFRLKFADLFSALIKYNSSPLFDILLDIENKNKPTFVFKFVPSLPGGSLFSGDRRAYECRSYASQNSNETEINMDEKYFSYYNCIENYDSVSNTVELVKTLGYFKEADENAREIFSEALTYSLVDLHKYMKVPHEATVQHEMYTKKFTLAKVANMDDIFPLIDWKTLFTNLVEDHHESIGEQVVQIYSINYFTYVFNELAFSAEGEREFAKDLNNALLAYAAQRLVEDFVEEHSLQDREGYCQYVTYSLMSQAASSAYLQSFTAADLIRMEDRARETFTLLKYTLNDEFKNAIWLDEESKTELYEQLGTINLAPYNWERFLLNNTYLDDYYRELSINSTNYFQNAISLVLLNKKHTYSMYQKNPLLPQYIWSHFKYPYQHTGAVIYALNTVVIPIGLLSKFSNDAPLPKYINMGGEGFVMAHALAHMFDFVGMKREFQKEDFKLSSHSASLFMDMRMCLISEYDFKKSYQAEDGNPIVFQTNGAFSVNERMADYTGMLIAYSTYLKYWGDSEELLPLISDWTPDQLFFLQAAQELCSKRKIYHHFVEIYEDVNLPSAIRVENIVSNSDEFSKAFNCPIKYHCDVFPRIPELDSGYPDN